MIHFPTIRMYITQIQLNGDQDKSAQTQVCLDSRTFRSGICSIVVGHSSLSSNLLFDSEIFTTNNLQILLSLIYGILFCPCIFFQIPTSHNRCLRACRIELVYLSSKGIYHLHRLDLYLCRYHSRKFCPNDRYQPCM